MPKATSGTSTRTSPKRFESLSSRFVHNAMIASQQLEADRQARSRAAVLQIDPYNDVCNNGNFIHDDSDDDDTVVLLNM